MDAFDRDYRLFQQALDVRTETIKLYALKTAVFTAAGLICGLRVIATAVAP